MTRPELIDRAKGFVQHDKLIEALIDLDEALEMAEDPYARRLRAGVLWLLKRYDAAALDFANLLTGEPASVELSHRLFHSMLRSSRPEAALLEARRFFQHIQQAGTPEVYSNDERETLRVYRDAFRDLEHDPTGRSHELDPENSAAG